MRKAILAWRYHYAVASVACFFFRPVDAFCQWLSRRIHRSVKVNGATISFNGVKVVFPRNIGVGFLSNIYWKKEAGFEPGVFSVVAGCAPYLTGFIDVGSHFGWYSVIVSKINPACSRYCYEALPELVQDATVFHAKNDALHRVDIIHKALSNRVGSVYIHVPTHEMRREVRSASIERDFFFNRKFPQVSVEVSCSTLDAEFGAYHSAWTTQELLLKIDVEGHEYAVLQGGQGFFRNRRPLVVCEVDTRGPHFTEFAQVIAEIDYCVYCIHREGLFFLSLSDLPGYPGGNDFLLVPGEKQAGQFVPFKRLEVFFKGPGRLGLVR